MTAPKLISREKKWWITHQTIQTNIVAIKIFKHMERIGMGMEMDDDGMPKGTITLERDLDTGHMVCTQRFLILDVTLSRGVPHGKK
mgnify:CR=1 FL=1